MSQETTRPLPGIRVEAAEPPVRTELPRMDIAAFIGFSEKTSAPAEIVAGDFKKPESFATKTVEKRDPFFRCLWETLSESTQESLSIWKNHKPHPPPIPSEAFEELIQKVNEILVLSPSLLDRGLVRRDQLRSRASQLLAMDPAGWWLARLNRLMIEDAYPSELVTSRDQPVVLEHPEVFSGVFGGDIGLAWDEDAGCVVNGQLGSAVRGFFAQGGKRCYVFGVAPPGRNHELDLSVFLDRDLADETPEALVTVANELQFGSPTPRELRGIHALLSVEEPSLISVPDAVLAGWSFEPATMAAKAPRAPVLSVRALGRNAVELRWTVSETATSYVVEEDSTASFASSTVVAETPESTLARQAAARDRPRRRFWRVRAVAGALSSDWSNAVSESLPAEVFGRCAGDAAPEQPAASPLTAEQHSPGNSTDLPRLKRPAEYTEADHAALLAVHRALLRMCRARGDLLAVLCLPVQADAGFAQRHVAALQPDSQSPLALARTFDVPPLSGTEAETLSFGTLYHPWLASAEADGSVSHSPPDGAVCGVIARRTLARGAWIAPANEALPGIVALQPTLTQTARQQLRQIQVNEIRLLPDGIRCLAADTLCPQPELRAINVRRVLMLLRRLAQREGAALVFEPHGDALRRWVQRIFEDLLDRLFRLGAFAGQTRAESFQVVTDESLNPPASVDAGSFIVELRVAPSQPMEFLAIRLVGSDGRLEVV